MPQVPQFQRPTHVKEDPVSLAFQMPVGYRSEREGDALVLLVMKKDDQEVPYWERVGEYGGQLAAMREAWLRAVKDSREAESSLNPPPGAKWFTLVCSADGLGRAVKMSMYGTCEEEVVTFFATLFHDEPFEFLTVIEHRQEVVDIFLHVSGDVEQIISSREGVRVIAASDDRDDVDNEIEAGPVARFAPNIDLIKHPQDLIAAPWVYRLPEVTCSPCVTRFYSDYLGSGDDRRRFSKSVIDAM